MCLIKDLKRQCGANYARPEKVWLIPSKDVDAIGAPVTDYTAGDYREVATVTLDAALTAGNKWQEWQFAKQSGNITITPEGDNDNFSWNVQITGNYPEFTPRANAVANDSLDAEVIAIVEIPQSDGTTVKQLVGTLDNPCRVRLSADASNGGWAVTVAWMGNNTPYLYTGSIAI